MTTERALPDGRPDGSAAADDQLARLAFGDVSAAAAYVPREVTERALDALTRGLEAPPHCVVVCGPPGLGKTLVLRVLESRLRATGLDAIYVPCATLALDDVCRWTIGHATGIVPDAPLESLERLVRRANARGSALHLVIDDANALPLETARALGDLLRLFAGDLRLALAGLDDARTGRMLAALAVDTLEVRLREPMSLEETRGYISGQLQRVFAPLTIWDRFGRGILQRLHGLSGGNPRRLNFLASEVIRGEAGQAALLQIEPGWNDALLERRRGAPRAGR